MNVEGLGYFILDEQGNPKEASGLEEWVQWMERENPQVAIDHIGDVKVSTIFLGIDHGFGFTPDRPPTLWETMVFGGPLDMYQRRYTSLDAAKAGHADTAARVQQAASPEVSAGEGEATDASA